MDMNSPKQTARVALPKAAIFSLLALVLSACGLPKPEVTSMADVGSGSVLIVGGP